MSKQIDLDDLPPKVAAQFEGLAEGEELTLVQGGAVVARLTAAAPEAPPTADEPAPDPEARAKEIFELFRSSVEDEF